MFWRDSADVLARLNLRYKYQTLMSWLYSQQAHVVSASMRRHDDVTSTLVQPRLDVCIKVVSTSCACSGFSLGLNRVYRLTFDNDLIHPADFFLRFILSVHHLCLAPSQRNLDFIYLFIYIIL